MHLGTAPTAGHPAMVVVKRKESVVKPRSLFVCHSYSTSTVTLAAYICVCIMTSDKHMMGTLRSAHGDRWSSELV